MFKSCGVLLISGLVLWRVVFKVCGTSSSWFVARYVLRLWHFLLRKMARAFGEVFTYGAFYFSYVAR